MYRMLRMLLRLRSGGFPEDDYRQSDIFYSNDPVYQV